MEEQSLTRESTFKIFHGRGRKKKDRRSYSLLTLGSSQIGFGLTIYSAAMAVVILKTDTEAVASIVAGVAAVTAGITAVISGMNTFNRTGCSFISVVLSILTIGATVVVLAMSGSVVRCPLRETEDTRPGKLPSSKMLRMDYGCVTDVLRLAIHSSLISLALAVMAIGIGTAVMAARYVCPFCPHHFSRDPPVILNEEGEEGGGHEAASDISFVYGFSARMLKYADSAEKKQAHSFA